MTAVPEQAAFRIDWPEWLRTRGQRDRRIIKHLLKGEQGRDVSRKLGLSPARVSQLRRAFKEDWERFGADEETDERVAIAA